MGRSSRRRSAAKKKENNNDGGAQVCNPRADAPTNLHQNLKVKHKGKLNCQNQGSSKVTAHQTHPDIVMNNTMQFLFEKKLKQSDVKHEGRIIIPKALAEKYMPKLETNGGDRIFMEDMIANRIWMFKYKFWQNNASRVYLLDGTGEMVKVHGLRAGDFIMIYKDKNSNKYGVKFRKCGNRDEAAMVQPSKKTGATQSHGNSISMARNYVNENISQTTNTTTSAHHQNAGLGISLLSSIYKAPPTLPTRSSEYSNGLQGFPFDLLDTVKISDLLEY